MNAAGCPHIYQLIGIPYASSLLLMRKADSSGCGEDGRHSYKRVLTGGELSQEMIVQPKSNPYRGDYGQTKTVEVTRPLHL